MTSLKESHDLVESFSLFLAADANLVPDLIPTNGDGKVEQSSGEEEENKPLGPDGRSQKTQYV